MIFAVLYVSVIGLTRCYKTTFFTFYKSYTVTGIYTVSFQQSQNNYYTVNSWRLWPV